MGTQPISKTMIFLKNKIYFALALAFFHMPTWALTLDNELKPRSEYGIRINDTRATIEFNVFYRLDEHSEEASGNIRYKYGDIVSENTLTNDAIVAIHSLLLEFIHDFDLSYIPEVSGLSGAEHGLGLQFFIEIQGSEKMARLYLSHFDERGMKYPYRLLLYLVSLFPENEQAILLYSLRIANHSIQQIVSLDEFGMKWPETQPELASDFKNDSSSIRSRGEITSVNNVPLAESKRLNSSLYFLVLLFALFIIIILYKGINKSPDT